MYVAGDLVAHEYALDHPLGRDARVVVSNHQSRQRSQIVLTLMT